MALTQAQQQAVALELVENYCPAAPDTIKAAAVDELIKWFRLSVEVQVSDGGQSVTNPSMLTRNGLFHSGASAYLSPWRRPRTAVVEVAPS